MGSEKEGGQGLVVLKINHHFCLLFLFHFLQNRPVNIEGHELYVAAE